MLDSEAARHDDALEQLPHLLVLVAGRQGLDAGMGRAADHPERVCPRSATRAVPWAGRPMARRPPARRYLLAAVALLSFAAPTVAQAQAPSPTTSTTEPGFHLEDGSPELDQLLKLIDQAKAQPRARHAGGRAQRQDPGHREGGDRGRSAGRGRPGPGDRDPSRRGSTTHATRWLGQGGAAQAGSRGVHQRARARRTSTSTCCSTSATYVSWRRRAAM